MGVRRQRATTTKEIMEKDIELAVKKAKARFRYNEGFYILKYIVQGENYYFASAYPDFNNATGITSFYQKWEFNGMRWVLVQ